MYRTKRYQFKKYRTQPAGECPVKHLCTARPAGREIDRASTRKALKKITNANEKPTIIPNTTRDKRTYIRYKKDNGVTITLI
jgi:hypothetical protein